MNRKRSRSPGRSGGRFRPATGAPDGNAAKLFAEAVAHHGAGAFAEAERAYGRFLALAPDHAQAQSRMGAVLMAQGRMGEAIAHLERALSLNPGLFEAYGNLAQAYMIAGRMEPAVHMLARALEIQETPQGQALFAEWVKSIQFRGEVDARIRQFVVRALVEGWAKPRELTRASVSLVKCDRAVSEWIRRAEAAWPARLAEAELFGASSSARPFADELLCRLLECDPIADVGLERLLTNVRYAMLARARCEAHGRRGATWNYSQPSRGNVSSTNTSTRCWRPRRRRCTACNRALSERICSRTTIPPLWPLAVGAYCPLSHCWQRSPARARLAATCRGRH